MKDMRSTQVRRQERYGIKKLSVGVASVLVATTLYFLPGSAQVLAASQANETRRHQRQRAKQTLGRLIVGNRLTKTLQPAKLTAANR